MNTRRLTSMWSIHREELARNWQLLTEGKEPKIDPLE